MSKYDDKVYVSEEIEVYLPLKIEDLAIVETAMRNFAAKHLIDVEDVELRTGQQWDYEVYDLWISAMRPPTDKEVAQRKAAARKSREHKRKMEQKEYERLKKKFGES